MVNVTPMNILTFSIFGDYLFLNTDNVETYMELLKLFISNGFYTSTLNTVSLKEDIMESELKTMPLFYKNNTVAVEINLERINFSVRLDSSSTVNELKEKFENEVLDILQEFIKITDIKANRVAINCSLRKKIAEGNFELPEVSVIAPRYFNSLEEQVIRNLKRELIAQELTNVSLERLVNYTEGTVSYLYDINSLFENSQMRFSKENIGKMYQMYMSKVLEIEEISNGITEGGCDG